MYLEQHLRRRGLPAFLLVSCHVYMETAPHVRSRYAPPTTPGKEAVCWRSNLVMSMTCLMRRGSGGRKLLSVAVRAAAMAGHAYQKALDPPRTAGNLPALPSPLFGRGRRRWCVAHCGRAVGHGVSQLSAGIQVYGCMSLDAGVPPHGGARSDS